MSFEEEFDKIIRQKVQQHNVPFDQSNWEKAQSMLDGQRTAVTAKKTVSMAKLLGLVGVGSLITVSSYFLINNNNTKQAAKHQTTSTEQSLQNKPEVQLNTLSNRVAAKPNALVANNTNQISNTRITEAQIKPNQVAKPSLKLQNNNIQIAAVASNQNTKQVTVNVSEQAQSNASQASGEGSSAALTQNNSSAKADNVASATNAQSQSQQSQSEANVPPVVVQNETQPPFNASTDQSLQMNGQVLEKSMVPATSGTKRFEPLTALALQMMTEQDTMLKTETSQSIINFIPRETNSTAKAKAKKHFFNLGIGVNYNSGWSAPEGRDGQGLNYFAHMNYGFYLSRKLSLGAGIDFYNIQNIHQAYYTAQKTEYAFSSSNTYTSVIANNLKYVGVPLKLYFDLNTTNILSLGILPSFLVASQNTVQMYQKLDGQKVNLTQTSNNLLYNGIAQKNIQFGLGYKTKLSARFWIQGEALIGLTDLFENNHSNQAKQNNLGLRLGLQYHIFDK